MIRNLNQGTPTTASQIPFGDTENGVDRRCSVSQLRDVILADVVSESWVTQYASPNASGFLVSIAPPVNGQSTWLILMPQAGYAVGGVKLPNASATSDRQEVEVLCTQSVAAFTVSVDGNSAAVNGAPTALSANDVFKLRYDRVTNTWYQAT